MCRVGPAELVGPVGEGEQLFDMSPNPEDQPGASRLEPEQIFDLSPNQKAGQVPNPEVEQFFGFDPAVPGYTSRPAPKSFLNPNNSSI